MKNKELTSLQDDLLENELMLDMEGFFVDCDGNLRRGVPIILDLSDNCDSSGYLEWGTNHIFTQNGIKISASKDA